MLIASWYALVRELAVSDEYAAKALRSLVRSMALTAPQALQEAFRDLLPELAARGIVEWPRSGQ